MIDLNMGDLDEHLREILKNSTFLFSELLELEVKEIKEDATVDNFCDHAEYAYRLFEEDENIHAPLELKNYLTGFGSKMMAYYQSHAKITLKTGEIDAIDF
jgi:hypothetical protein